MLIITTPGRLKTPARFFRRLVSAHETQRLTRQNGEPFWVRMLTGWQTSVLQQSVRDASYQVFTPAKAMVCLVPVAA